MTIATVVGWFVSNGNGNGNGRKPPAKKETSLDIALRRFDSAQEEHVKAHSEFIGTIDLVRAESAQAADLARATLECECQPEVKQ